MKKALYLILTFMLLLSLCACSESGTKSSVTSGAKTQTETGDENKKEPEKTNTISIADQLEIGGYSYKSDWSNYFFMTIKNNSSLNADVFVEVNFYDSDGNIVGAKSGSQEAIESGHSVLLYFMPDEDYASVEYELTAEEETWYECVQSDLTYEATEAKDKIILSVTNNGEEAAEFVEASVLFFKGEDIVGFSQNYTTDSDSELKPGKTINKEMDCYQEFDSYEVFLTGRR